MRAVIAVEALARAPGSYEITIVTRGGRKLIGLSAGRSPGEAAAKAAHYAICHCLKGGDIVAPENVLKLIPEHLRSIPEGGHPPEVSK